jgi:hypothetical protein
MAQLEQARREAMPEDEPVIILGYSNEQVKTMTAKIIQLKPALTPREAVRKALKQRSQATSSASIGNSGKWFTRQKYGPPDENSRKIAAAVAAG